MDPVDPFFSKFLATTYAGIKLRHPLEGRRKWRLRAIRQFWDMPRGVKQNTYKNLLSQAEPSDESDFIMDEDLFDEITDDEAPGLGILVRTDFSNDEAWRSFLEKLKEGEDEFKSSAEDEEDAEMDQDGPLSADASATSPDAEMGGENDGSESSSDGDTGPIISILDPSPEVRPYFSDISNLAALRLLNDVDLRRLAIPPNVKRFSPPNPIVDYDGWQEIYHGKTLWIYDATSNQDQCARLISKHSDFYGTATGDSWRTKVSHICELQVNISTGVITIDFGGMDRYTYEERVRNLRVAMEA